LDDESSLVSAIFAGSSSQCFFLVVRNGSGILPASCPQVVFKDG
jgi:hypothetical protein